MRLALQRPAGCGSSKPLTGACGRRPRRPGRRLPARSSRRRGVALPEPSQAEREQQIAILRVRGCAVGARQVRPLAADPFPCLLGQAVQPLADAAEAAGRPPARRSAGSPAGPARAAGRCDTAAPAGGRAPRQGQHVAADSRTRCTHASHTARTGSNFSCVSRKRCTALSLLQDRLRRRLAARRPDDVGGQGAQVGRGRLRQGQQPVQVVRGNLTAVAGRRRNARGPGAVARTPCRAAPARRRPRCGTSSTPSLGRGLLAPQGVHPADAGVFRLAQRGVQGRQLRPQRLPLRRVQAALQRQ